MFVSGPGPQHCHRAAEWGPHLLSPGSRGTSTPTASSPMTRGCSPCRWVQGVPPGPGGAPELGVGRMQLCRARAARPPRRSSLRFVFCTRCRMRALCSRSSSGGGAASAQHPRHCPSPFRGLSCPHFHVPSELFLVPSSLQLPFLPPIKSMLGVHRENPHLLKEADVSMLLYAPHPMGPVSSWPFQLTTGTF